MGRIGIKGQDQSGVLLCPAMVDRAHAKGPGISRQRGDYFLGDIETRAEESAASIVRGLRADYLSSARGEFARLHSGLYASADMVKHGAMEPPCTKGKVLEIREIRWLFPTSLSPTLADLIDEITGFGIDIVIAAAAVD